jgi:hypothetical protein
MEIKNFDVNVIESILKDLKNDPVIGNYNLTVDLSDPEIPFLIWNNPQDDEQWRNSGYAEDYDGNFTDVNPMPVIALLNLEGNNFAYKLEAEEKYYKSIIFFEDEGPEESQLVKINTIDDVKEAITQSIWEC